MAQYKYAEGNLLEERNTYFYTQFQGIAFVNSWISARQKYLVSENVQMHPNSPVDCASLDDLQNAWQESGCVETKELLNLLYEGIRETGSAPISPELVLLIDQLVKRFEITKRIYTTYSREFRSHGKKDYHDLSLYLQVADIFEKIYSLSNNLSYLNVLLKCIDTLCSQYDSLDLDGKKRLGVLIHREKTHVLALAKDKGIPL